MGQALSRKAEHARPQLHARQEISEYAHTRRTRHPSGSHVHDNWATPKGNHRSAQTVSHPRTTNVARRNSSRLNPVKEVDGNIGTPRRQQKYGRGKPIKNPSGQKGHQRTNENDGRHSIDLLSDLSSPKTRNQHLKSVLRHTKPAPYKECIVCTDTRPLHRFPTRPPTAECKHEPDVCRRCVRTWIQSEFKSKIWNEINCPICAARLQYDDIMEFAPRDVFRRYDRLNVKAVYDNIPNWRWCFARGCKHGQVHTPGQSRFRCKKCKKSYCVEHGVVWHKDETCREYDYRTNKSFKKQEEVASKKLIADTTKKCPGCKRSIEKSFGCDHMTCTRCKHEFCWLCLAPYVQKGVRRVVHRPGCQYHSPIYYDSD